MRSSNKSRSRNKNNNRNRNVGNVVNRVFDSAGPEGKVRGTPSQIIEKYTALARDAQLSGDRVAAENFQQHAEHYSRLLNEAMREQAERQAADARNRQQNQPANGNGASGNGHEAEQDPAPVVPSDPGSGDQPDVAFGAGPELVETPEAAAAEKPERKPRSRSRRPAPKPAGKEAAAAAQPVEAQPDEA